MKKILLVLAVAALSTSCMKRHHCVCGNQDITDTYIIHGSNNAAEQECAGKESLADWECEIW